MSTDNRTTLNLANSVTSWVSDGASPSLNTLTGQRYEGSGCIDGQHTNADEATYTTAIGGTRNLSDATVYFLLKDNLVNTYANGGVQGMFTDGTDRIGYDMGGNDAPGLDLEPYYRGFKFDVSVVVAAPGSNFTTYSGSEANLDQTAITGVGIGTLHLAKAQGNVPNIFIDAMRFIANDSYALTINGGTAMTPETTADVQGDDETNGWGMVGQPKPGQFDFFAPTQWGNPTATADVYYEAIDEQWFWIGDNNGGRAVGATHFPMRITGNATDTESITWRNLVIVNVGTRAQFTVGNTNVNTIDWDNVTLTNVGTVTFPAQAAGRTHDTVTFNNCDQVAPNGCNGTIWAFNGGFNANGSMLLDTAGDSDNITGVTFASDGTGHAIDISATGTYDFNDWTFTGYGADATSNAVVRNNSGGAVTINVLGGGDTPTVLNVGMSTTTINNSVTVTVDGVAEGTACKVIANETAGTVTAGDVLGQGLADSTGAFSFTMNYEGAFGAGLDVLIVARNQGLPNAAIADDGGVQTDETTAANSGTSDDMTLTPATPAVNDAYYFGHHEANWRQLKINVSNVSTDTGQTITWEYWTGMAWAALSGVVDGTNNWRNTGLNTVSWTLPSWATTTVNSQGPYYYVRARVSAVGGTPDQALGRWVTLDATRYLPIPPQGNLVRTITSSGLTATLTQAVDNISTF